ncbi:MAG: sigma-70 family RNA polymerase sigma factor [Mucilaginibacter sp.]
MNDDELICLLQKGDEVSFTEIYDRYWDKLYFIAYKLLKDTSAAEEIVQEVFLTLWKKRESLSIKSIAPYLAAMTRYAVYRHAAQMKNSKRQENLLGILNAEAILEIDINQKILLEIITEMSNKLPEKCRLVFQYNKLQDMSLAEVAENLNISPKTAEGHLTKALRIIRTNFDSPMSDLLFFILAIRLFIK